MDPVSYTFGPRYTWTPSNGKVSLNGQGLAGGARSFNGIFPHTGAP
ncbi:MAG: hypothetical protein ACLGRW_03285 [Acidobacteriota bacterium]|jgi:hypothetical protein